MFRHQGQHLATNISDNLLKSPKESPVPASDLWDSPFINTSERRVSSFSSSLFDKKKRAVSCGLGWQETQNSRAVALDNKTRLSQAADFGRIFDLTDGLRGMKKAKAKATFVEDSMQVVMKPYLLLGQLFGLLPVCGIASDNPNDLRFSWKAKKVLYALILFVITLIVAVLQVCGSIMLYGLSLGSLGCLSKAKEARNAKTAIVLQQESKSELFEILLAARVIGRMAMLHECTDDFWVLLELAFLSQYYALFSLIGFTFYTAVVPAALFLHRCVVTVYDELTMITLTYCLYLRFRQLYQHLLKSRHQKMSSNYWAEMRETYNTLSHLTKLLDNHLSWMTIVCFGSNLYYICDLLLRTFSFENNNKWTSWTMLYILLFDLARTFGAALMAALVHEESKKPLALLFCVPSDCYCGEFDLARTFGTALMAALVHEESKKPLALHFCVPSDCYCGEPMAALVHEERRSHLLCTSAYPVVVGRLLLWGNKFSMFHHPQFAWPTFGTVDGALGVLWVSTRRASHCSALLRTQRLLLWRGNQVFNVSITSCSLTWLGRSVQLDGSFGPRGEQEATCSALLRTQRLLLWRALMAALVHEESKKPLALHFCVPSDCYCGEVYRFQMQVTHDEVLISGCRFFSLTRSFMLTRIQHINPPRRFKSIHDFKLNKKHHLTDELVVPLSSHYGLSYFSDSVDR
ncbi:sweet taste receptor activity protein [Homalodisca vitripennis]|nr:sweet taste receptor activity protein [Homalodisca vitripennis]